MTEHTGLDEAAQKKTGPKPRSVAVRFMAKVVLPPVGNEDGCWLWSGKARSDNGYPLMNDEHRQRRASQVSWELHHHQPFPKGLFACHTCDNPGCVNPHHIWPGTSADNMADAKRKGRPLGLPRQEFCRRGHHLTEENTRPGTRGGRACLACRRLGHIKLTEKRRTLRARAALSAARPSREG